MSVAVEMRFVNSYGAYVPSTNATDEADTAFSNRKRVSHQAGLLAFVTNQRANGGTGAGFAASVGNFGAENCPQTRLDESPRAHVFRFFLAPDVLRGLWKWLEHFAQFLFGQRVKLLDANDRCVVDVALGSVIEQVVINFARAKDNSLHFFNGTRLGRTEDFFEPAVDKFFGRRGSKLRSQQTLRRHDDERLNEVAFHLAPQSVKILRCGGQIADLDVVLGASLQKPLQSGAGVLRALPLITMWEQQNNATVPLPFRFRGNNELIDNGD